MKKQLPLWIKYYKALLKFFNSALKEEELSMKMGELKGKLIRRLHKNPFVFKADEYGIIEWYIRSSKDNIKVVDEIKGIEDVIQKEKDINIVIKDILKPEAQDIETPQEAEAVMEVVNEIMKLSSEELKTLNEVSSEELKGFSSRGIASLIESGEAHETKEILMKADKYGNSVAHYLAGNSDVTNWATDDKDILMLTDLNLNSVAHFLARYHPTWTTDDLDVLSMADLQGTTVEDVLIINKKI